MLNEVETFRPPKCENGDTSLVSDRIFDGCTMRECIHGILPWRERGPFGVGDAAFHVGAFR